MTGVAFIIDLLGKGKFDLMVITSKKVNTILERKSLSPQ